MDEGGQKVTDKVRLNVGCGKNILDGYINVDSYVPPGMHGKVTYMDARDLQFPSESVDEILSIFVLEHIEFWELRNTLFEWWRVLKPGGKLTIKTDNFVTIAQMFLNGEIDIRDLQYYIHNANPLDRAASPHRSALTPEYLDKILRLSGFKVIRWYNEEMAMVFECERMPFSYAFEQRRLK